ncbi:FAD:protein FMN transferase [Sphingobium sp. H39-3-25]|nr:FAD:protein FMN transferase [Sphingobium arseniciresistens]
MRIALPARIDMAAMNERNPDDPVVALDGVSMGTIWRVLYAAAPSMDAGLVRSGIASRLEGLVAEMSHWEPSSLLCRFNHLPGGQWASLPHDFAKVMDAAFGIAGQSGGAFDPAAGKLVDIWGFGPPGPAAAPPADAAIREALDVSGWTRLSYDRGARRLRQPGGLALDLSAIAKGYAVDALAELLGEMGIGHALVEVGGELSGHGFQPDGQPWWVDIETPPDVAVRPLRVALHGLAVATSGTYVRGAHNLDPRSGQPAAGGVIACTVIHASAMVADAWATAFTVLGPEKGLGLARELGLAARFLNEAAAGIEERFSPAFSQMLED